MLYINKWKKIWDGEKRVNKVILEASLTLTNLSKTIMPNMVFDNKEAINMIPYDTYDILSHGIFRYFDDLDYCKEVIKKVINISNHKIAILDINDEFKKDEYHKNRMGNMNKEEYEKKYNGFEDIAKEFNLKINIFDKSFEQYKNYNLRFNLVMEK